MEATGEELDELGRPFDARGLIGREVIVEGATPTANQDGWLIYAWTKPERDIYTFPERALVSTGKIETTNDDGTIGQADLDLDLDGWRDDVLVSLDVGRSDASHADSICVAASEQLAAIEGVSEVASRVTRSGDDHATIDVWLWTTGDALDVFERVIAIRPDAWSHDDESRFISSRWEKAGTAAFLHDRVIAADVVYRRWISPDRRSRRHH